MQGKLERQLHDMVRALYVSSIGLPHNDPIGIQHDL